MSKRANKRNRKRYSVPQKDSFHFFEAERIGLNDIKIRIPELTPLRNKKIGIVGLGNLGAPSAIEFAKSGISELRIMDHDSVEGGTIVRWPFGLEAIGQKKVECLNNFISSNFPYTNVVPKIHRIGSTEKRHDGRSELQIIGEFINGLDLIYDATAEYGVSNFLSDLCREKEIAYMCVSASFGLWGGRIYRIVPGKTEGCWVCFQIFREKNKEWVPVADPNGKVHPKGCAAPTFTGANFDSLQLSSTGVRLAVSTLCDGIANGYPSFNHDVFVVDFRDPYGKAITPAWRSFNLKKHDECPRCNPS